MRQTSRPPLARMLEIDLAVRAGRWPTSKTLARQLEVHPRTVRRDITFMRDRLGAPLAFDPLRNGYHYTQPNYQLPFVKVTEGELVALLLAERLFGQYRGTPFESDLRRAFGRLRDMLPDAVSIRLDSIGDCLAVLPLVEIDYDPRIFATLAKAAVESRRIEVVYHTAGRDAVTERTLEPYSLFVRDESWYALARDSLRQEVRVFAVQRFREARDTGERFTRPADFRMCDYLADSFGVIRGTGVHHVSLRFRPPSAMRVAERRWRPDQSIEHFPDGCLILRFAVNDLREVLRWTLSWGADCQVLEPGELREAVVKELRRTLEAYSGKANLEGGT